MEFKADQEVAKRFSWVTQLDADALNVSKLVAGGRSRWKIENETFNTKTQKQATRRESLICIVPWFGSAAKSLQATRQHQHFEPLKLLRNVNG